MIGLRNRNSPECEDAVSDVLVHRPFMITQTPGQFVKIPGKTTHEIFRAHAFRDGRKTGHVRKEAGIYLRLGLPIARAGVISRLLCPAR